MNQISAMTDRYQEFCGQLNVGVFRMETLQLRRTSQTTGRLVPIFEPREYDDPRWPQRELPPIDKRNVDNSGNPSSDLVDLRALIWPLDEHLSGPQFCHRDAPWG